MDTDNQGVRARPSDQALVSDQAPTGLDPSGFDPSRKTTSNAEYGVVAYGILNPWGDFWTFLAFESEKQARQHIDRFWGPDHDTGIDFQKRCRIVPVKVTIEAIAMEAAPAGETEGLDPKGDSAGLKGIAHD